MKGFILLLALVTTGCQTFGSNLTVVGSAYVESERPEGKAVAKVEVRYTPPARRTLDADPATDARPASIQRPGRKTCENG